MADDEETEFEEEAPTPVQVLPPEPPPRQWNWVKLVGVGLGFVLAWHTINRVGERFGTPSAPAAAQQAAVIPSPPREEPPPVPRERPRVIDRMLDEPVPAETPSARSEAWKPQIRLREPLWRPVEQERPRDHVQEAPDPGLERADRRLQAMEEPEDDLERAMRERQVLRDWGPPPCPPGYHHQRSDRSWSCWPN